MSKIPRSIAELLILTKSTSRSTPTEKATFQWHQAPNSVLMVRHGDDHVSFNGKFPMESLLLIP